MEHFQRSHPFYSPNSDCEMTQYFNQLYLICTPAEDRATCVVLLPWLAGSMPTGCLWAALDCRLPVSVAHSAHPSPIHPPLASLQWKYQVIGCWALVNSVGNSICKQDFWIFFCQIRNTSVDYGIFECNSLSMPWQRDIKPQWPGRAYSNKSPQWRTDPELGQLLYSYCKEEPSQPDAATS